MEEIVYETNQIREVYSHVKERSSKKFLTELIESLANTTYLSKQSCVESFIEDVKLAKNDQKKINLFNTKQHINSVNDNFLFSVFNSPYFPDLSIESCFYEPLSVNQTFSDKYQSKVMPVNIKMASNGFHSRVVVALFPENHIDKIQLKDDLIFYFINKFVIRFFRITRKMLENVMGNDFFAQLSIASKDEIQDAAVYWVNLHEYYHHKGFLPLPQYIRLKSIKALAGLEELRVDVCSIIACLEEKPLGREKSEFVAQFILAERLLRYSVEGIPKPNYDAIASQLLFNFLRQHNCIHIEKLKIYLSANIWEALKKFINTIDGIEAKIKTQTQKEVQQNLLKFTKQYTNFDENTKEFHHIKYFEQVKKWLNV